MFYLTLFLRFTHLLSCCEATTNRTKLANKTERDDEREYVARLATRGTGEDERKRQLNANDQNNLHRNNMELFTLRKYGDVNYEQFTHGSSSSGSLPHSSPKYVSSAAEQTGTTSSGGGVTLANVKEYIDQTLSQYLQQADEAN